MGKAKKSIKNSGTYIVKQGYPDRAEKFIKQLYAFGHSLAIFPGKFPICRHTAYARHNYRCATFKKDYVFVHKLIKNQLYIYNIIHAKRMR